MASRSTAVSALLLLQIAVPFPKLNPPHSLVDLVRIDPDGTPRSEDVAILEREPLSIRAGFVMQHPTQQLLRPGAMVDSLVKTRFEEVLAI